MPIKLHRFPHSIPTCMLIAHSSYTAPPPVLILSHRDVCKWSPFLPNWLLFAFHLNQTAPSPHGGTGIAGNTHFCETNYPITSSSPGWLDVRRQRKSMGGVAGWSGVVKTTDPENCGQSGWCCVCRPFYTRTKRFEMSVFLWPWCRRVLDFKVQEPWGRGFPSVWYVNLRMVSWVTVSWRMHTEIMIMVMIIWKYKQT